MVSKLSWPQIFTLEAIREIFFNFLWSKWSMWSAPIMVAALGIFEGYSLTLIFMFCVAVFALAAFGLNQFSIRQISKTPQDKIRFSQPMIGVKKDESLNPAKLEGMRLGVTAHNAAQFPIEVSIDKLETQIADLVPKEDFFSRSVTVSMDRTAQFSNGIIDLSREDLVNKTLIGTINAKITYGRPGKLKYEGEQKWWIAIKFDNDGQPLLAETSQTEMSKV